MSAAGVFCVSRGVFKHPMFEGEAYSRRDAWLWLLGNAVWKETRVRVGKAMIDLQRGQLAFSTRFLARAWKWSEVKVRRFLGCLESERMIVAEPTRWATQITICNYEDYQFSGRGSDAPIDAEVTQKRRGSDAKKKNLITEELSLVHPQPVAEGLDRFFSEFYSAYPRRQSKQDAIKAYAQVRKAGVSHQSIMAGLERAKRSDQRFRELRFTPLPASWLRAGGFDDDTAAPADDWKKAVYV